MLCKPFIKQLWKINKIANQIMFIDELHSIYYHLQSIIKICCSFNEQLLNKWFIKHFIVNS